METAHKIVLTPRLESVQEAQDFVTHWAGHYGMGDGGIHHCLLSVDEVITNIVEHGFEFKEDAGTIEVTLEKISEMLVIEVTDTGPLFNPLMHPEPDPTLPLWDREGGGWGIHFVKKFMDGAAYHSTGSRNHLRMEKRIQ
jgi:anti-sigma regulatory factor (Ser/Thr protein kinase)